MDGNPSQKNEIPPNFTELEILNRNASYTEADNVFKQKIRWEYIAMQYAKII